MTLLKPGTLPADRRSMTFDLGPRAPRTQLCPHDRPMTASCPACGVPAFDHRSTPTGALLERAERLEEEIRRSWSVRAEA